MLRTLGDIYNHTNDTLLGGALNGLSEVIEYYEECQQIINEKDPIEAPILYTTLTTNGFVLPNDFMSIKKLVFSENDVEIEPVEIWAKRLTLSKDYTSGEVKLYYYKKPTVLDYTNLDQVPDIDSRYFPALAKYAAEMYYLTDDDEEMREAFKNSYFESLTIFGRRNNNKKYNYKNLW